MSPLPTETQALLVKAGDNIRAAQVLRREKLDDIAASRAYYALFYVAEALLLAQGGQTFASHAAVIAAYGREFAKTAQLDPRFHRYLIDAQDLRHSGDYETGVTVSPDEVDAAIQWAQEFLAAAEVYLKAKA